MAEYQTLHCNQKASEPQIQDQNQKEGPSRWSIYGISGESLYSCFDGANRLWPNQSKYQQELRNERQKPEGIVQR